VSRSDIKDSHFVLLEKEARHLHGVLKKSPGATISLFDGEGGSYRAQVDRVTAKTVTGRILEKNATQVKQKSIRLFQGLPKGDKFSWLLEKVAELGLLEIIPIYTEHGIRMIPEEKISSRLRRWENILLAGAKLSHQQYLTKITRPKTFSEALGEFPKEKNCLIIPWEQEKEQMLKNFIKAREWDSVNKNQTINIFIGPEGGFTVDEIKNAKSHRAIPVSLGPHIFRSETAGLYVLSVLHYELG